MKSKKLLALTVIGMLSIGGTVQAYAQISNNKTSKNKVMTESVASTQVNKKENKENEIKKIALTAFKNYFNEKIDVNNLDQEVKDTDMQGQKNYLVSFGDKKQYFALINSDTNKVLHLEAKYGAPKNEEYKNYSYNDAKTLSANFIKESNIIGKNYILSEETGKEINASKDGWGYYFYFQYNGNKQALVTVDKGTKKISSFILLDEINTQG